MSEFESLRSSSALASGKAEQEHPIGKQVSEEIFAKLAERNPKFVHPDTLPEGDPKRQLLALIGHGHLDYAWLWDYSHGKARAIHTAKSALTLMDRNDDFIYTQSSPKYLQIIEQVDKGLHKEIVDRSQQGRWDNVGGGWVEPDMNLPLAGSLQDSMRHAQQYYRNHMGIEPPTVALAADAFGHPELQKLLLASGYTMYFHMRPQRGELWLPNGIYEWGNRQGDKIDAERIFEEYGSGKNTTRGHITEAANQLGSPLDLMSVWYGVCNHGGGPTQKEIDIIKSLQDDPNLPQLLFMTTYEYHQLARSLREKFPAFIGELQYHARGGYSLGVKGNTESRRAENAKERSRRFSVMANRVVGTAYPKEDYQKAEQEMLTNDFHDVRERTIIQGAEQAVDDGHGFAATVFRNEADVAMLSLTQEVRIQAEENTEPYVAVNAHTFPVREYIEVEEYGLADQIQVFDGSESPIPHQLVRPEGIIRQGNLYRRRVGLMLDLPAGGYSSFTVKHGLENSQTFENLTANPELLENEQTRVRFDPKTGLPIEIIDKTLDYNFIAKDNDGNVQPAFVPVLCNDTANGKTVDTWGHKKDQWRPNINDDGSMETFSLAGIEILEQGPVKATVRVTSIYRDPRRTDQDGNSKLVMEYSLYNGTGRIDIDVRLDWYEKHKMLKLLIPVALESRQTTAEGVFQPEIRDHTGGEWPTRNFVDISGRRRDRHEYAGLTISNNGAPGYSVDNGNLMLSLVRSPDKATHDPSTNSDDTPHDHTDQGELFMRFSLQTHTGDLSIGKAIKTSQAFNKEPYVELQTYNPDGKLEPVGSFYELDADNIYVDSLKMADDPDSDDLVVTLFETDNRYAKGTLRLFEHEIPLSLKPGELRILRIRRDGLYFTTNVEEVPIG